MSLENRTIALLIAPRGTEEVEFVEPRRALQHAGAKVTIIGFEKGEVQTNVNDLDPGGTYRVEEGFSDACIDHFDALVIPGGSVGADKLRGNTEAVKFVRAFFEAGKPVGAICHAPWLLVEADVLKGRTLTSFPTVRTDIENAGGHWVDEQVVVDQGLVTSRKPDDLPAFCAKLIETFAQGHYPEQPPSP
ncbi:type 1 glutamine amidotransferase domain-containing protein [Novosphingobium sp. 9]|uniref:type 1 glutamine amidotransferase domain-containing protein n=1 Tax=Novosphingobium sp. 9 TaxID=2025349 RepID=UPI0021B6616F|nr:type 1 glutamine amidotransferase domain-containing protein [Novosphingobium sp. 9]